MENDLIADKYLGALAADIASLIRHARDDSALRLYACEVVRMGVRRSGISLPTELLNLFEVAQEYSKGRIPYQVMSAARGEAEATQSKLADRAADCAQLYEDGTIEDEEVYNSSAAAMLGWAIIACTSKSARGAAAWASYEVGFAVSRDSTPESEIHAEFLHLARELRN